MDSPAMKTILLFMILATVSLNAAASTWYASRCAAHYDAPFPTPQAVADDFCATPSACQTNANMNDGATATVGGDQYTVTALCSGTITSTNQPGTLGTYLVGVQKTGICPSPTVDDGFGGCKENCPAAGTVKSSGIYDLGTNPEALPPTTACDGGCETSYSGSGVDKRAMINGVYHYFSTGSYNHTGQTCTGPAGPTASPTLPPNSCNPETQQTGQVNGVTVCLDKSQSNNTNTTTSVPVTDPATGIVTTTTTTTNTNTGTGDTTTTMSSNQTSPDGSSSSSSSETTTKAPKSSFCQANPTDPTCLKNSKICEDNPETLGCATLGTVEDSVVPTVEKGISEITPKTIGGAGACPAPVTASFMGQSISFSYDLPCQAAGMLRPLILALSWLSAGLIFIGGVKQ